MANLLRVQGDPLSDRNVALVIKELEQTAVAASVVGTSPRRLRELARLVEVIADALVGERPETKKLATRLRQLVHGVKTSGIKNYQSPRAMRALAAGVAEVSKLIKRGIGNAPVAFTVGDFAVRNTWGYSEAEAQPALRVLGKVGKTFSDVGLRTAASTVELWDTGAAPEYVRELDAIVVDPDRSELEGLIKALGRRLWDEEFRQADFETWGGKDPRRFVAAFASTMSGGKLDAETAARLQVTVGKLAARWPEVA
jgi:hypothetical protein